jgi:Ran GTPase-activating protein (RanGAP) involved in mRNA processing and transport
MYYEKTLKELYLYQNQIGEKGAKHFMEALKANTVRHGSLSLVTADYFSTKKLSVLDLAYNNIGVKGAESLAQVFVDNKVRHGWLIRYC